MRKLLLACALFLIWPVAASSGPKEDALLVVEQFKKAFDASDVEGVVKLFAPDAVFLGTVSPVLATKTDQIDKYFQGLRQFMPRSITIEDHRRLGECGPVCRYGYVLTDQGWKRHQDASALHHPDHDDRSGLAH